MTKPNEKQVEKIKEKVEEWLDVTGAISKNTGWYYELMSFFDEEVAQSIADAVAEERTNITQEVKKATEPLVEALKDMLFAHQNCDPEFPHEYEIKARERAEALLKAHKEKYGE